MSALDAETGAEVAVGELPVGPTGLSVTVSVIDAELGITPVGPKVMAVGLSVDTGGGAKKNVLETDAKLSPSVVDETMPEGPNVICD